MILKSLRYANSVPTSYQANVMKYINLASIENLRYSDQDEDSASLMT